MKELESKFHETSKLMSEIDLLVRQFSDGRIHYFFDDLTIKITFKSAEASFIRIVSWIYVILHEGSAKINYLFIIEKFQLYSSSLSFNDGIEFKKLCHSARTVLQHNLNLSRSEDQVKLYTFEDWLENTCEKKDLLEEKDWLKCSNELLDLYLKILNSTRDALLLMDDLEEPIHEIIIEDWITKIERNYSEYDYLLIVNKITFNFGITSFNSELFCKRNYNKWLSEAKTIKNLNFQDFAQRQIERDFIIDLKNKKLPLPISSDEVIAFFSLKPGPALKIILEKIHDRYYSDPCSKEELVIFTEGLINEL